MAHKQLRSSYAGVPDLLATLTRAIMEPNLSTTIVIQGGSGATKTMHRPETSKDTPSAVIRATSIQAIAIHHLLSWRHPFGAGVIHRQLSHCHPPTSTNQVGIIHRHRGGTSFISAIAEAPPSEQMRRHHRHSHCGGVIIPAIAEILGVARAGEEVTMAVAEAAVVAIAAVAKLAEEKVG